MATGSRCGEEQTLALAKAIQLSAHPQNLGISRNPPLKSWLLASAADRRWRSILYRYSRPGTPMSRRNSGRGDVNRRRLAKMSGSTRGFREDRVRNARFVIRTKYGRPQGADRREESGA